jgi:hypothetical protein
MSDLMDPVEFGELVDVLRERLFDAEAIRPGELHSFKTLLSDGAVWMPEGWYQQLYDELEALGHLDPPGAGGGFGDVEASLSADGRAYVRAERGQRADLN